MCVHGQEVFIASHACWKPEARSPEAGSKAMCELHKIDAGN